MRCSMTRRRLPTVLRRPLALCGVLILAANWLAVSGPVEAWGGSNGSSVGCDAINGKATCTSVVVFKANGTGSTVAAPSNWVPPACWYEPSFFTPTFLRIAYLLPVFGDLVPLITGGDTGTNGDFHDGQKGHWWGFVYNPSMPVADAQAQCQLTGGPILEWVPDAVPVPREAVTAWKMAAAAAKVIPVNPPTLSLQPEPGNQVVNLPTSVSFTNPLPRAWVTATLNVNGFALAATSIATPASLTVNAGTSDASPSSCTYSLTPKGGDYQVDPSSARCSDGSSGTNAGIVYRRRTPAGVTYPLTATVTWNVTWTDTASPDSPPQATPALGPMTLTTPPIPVAVKEIESVN